MLSILKYYWICDCWDLWGYIEFRMVVYWIGGWGRGCIEFDNGGVDWIWDGGVHWIQDCYLIWILIFNLNMIWILILNWIWMIENVR